MICFLADQSKITIKLKNNLVLPSPNHSFRNSCLLLMCGTRKLQCHVQGLQPIEICGIGKWAQMILLCPLPSLPWHHHGIQNLQGERDRALVTWTRKKTKTKKKLFLIAFLYALANSFPPICHLPSMRMRAFLGHCAAVRIWTTVGETLMKRLLHLTNGPSSKSPTKRPHSPNTKPPATH